ncbi:TMEM43 [Symbiodinium sp. CCMP2592]|nr:TMEM43 [Symbiodinium sp. CCMP2592]
MPKIPRATVRTSFLAWAAITLAFAWTGSPLPWRILPGHVHGDSEPAPVEFSRNRDNPFIDAVAGTICAGIAFTLLWLNEGHAVRIEQLLDLVRRRVIEIGPTAVPGNQRQLVYLQGDATSADQLVLSEWANISAPANSAKLRAQAFMYQWEQEKDDQSVKYKKVWKNHRINSDRFQYSGHHNPVFPVAPTCMKLAKVAVGDFVLSKKMLGKLQNYKPCEISNAAIQAINANPRMSRYGVGQLQDFSPSWFQSQKPAVFFPIDAANSLANPGIGDLILIFEYVPCGPVSLLGVQVPFEAVHAGQILVPGIRCHVSGKAAEICEVTPPPRPIKVHFTERAMGADTDFFEVSDVQCTDAPDPWEVGPNHWTFVPLFSRFRADALDFRDAASLATVAAKPPGVDTVLISGQLYEGALSIPLLHALQTLCSRKLCTVLMVFWISIEFSQTQIAFLERMSQVGFKVVDDFACRERGYANPGSMYECYRFEKAPPLSGYG